VQASRGGCALCVASALQSAAPLPHQHRKVGEQDPQDIVYWTRVMVEEEDSERAERDPALLPSRPPSAGFRSLPPPPRLASVRAQESSKDVDEEQALLLLSFATRGMRHRTSQVAHRDEGGSRRIHTHAVLPSRHDIQHTRSRRT